MREKRYLTPEEVSKEYPLQPQDTGKAPLQWHWPRLREMWAQGYLHAGRHRSMDYPPPGEDDMKKPRNPRKWAKEHNYRKQSLSRADLIAGKDHCATCKHYTLRMMTATGQCALHNLNLVRWNAVCGCFDRKEAPHV